MSAVVDLFAKVGAMVVATTYVLGFVLVAMHQTRLGINHLDLFKPKIVAAGVACTLLTLIPAASALSFFRQGLGRVGEKRLSKRHALFLVGAYLAASRMMAALLAPWLFVRDAGPIVSFEQRSWIEGSLLGVAAVLFVWSVVRRGTRLGAWLAIISGTAFIIASVLADNRVVPALALWFFASGLIVVLAVKAFRDETFVSVWSGPWEHSVATPFVLLWLYSGCVYRYLEPAFGGGLLPAVTVQLDRDVSVASSERSFKAFLVDETDHGLYLARDRDGKQAFFVTRAAVLGIAYERPSDPQRSPGHETEASSR